MREAKTKRRSARRQCRSAAISGNMPARPVWGISPLLDSNLIVVNCVFTSDFELQLLCGDWVCGASFMASSCPVLWLRYFFSVGLGRDHTFTDVCMCGE